MFLKSLCLATMLKIYVVQLELREAPEMLIDYVLG